MKWLPSQHVPPLPWRDIDWKLRVTFGRAELSRLWLDMWLSGVAAGRIEGVVGTVLVVLVLSVLALGLFVALKEMK